MFTVTEDLQPFKSIQVNGFEVSAANKSANIIGLVDNQYLAGQEMTINDVMRSMHNLKSMYRGTGNPSPLDNLYIEWQKVEQAKTLFSFEVERYRDEVSEAWQEALSKE